MNKALGVLIVVIVVVAIALGISHDHNTNKNTSTTQTAAITYKTDDVTITGAGSTFAAPLYGQLGTEYKAKTQTTLNYQAVGSGAGVAQFIANTVNFGATDVALTDAEVTQAQAVGNPLNIPTAFGAVTVSYNLPGVKSGLKLDGPTIADIYLGKITNWNDSAISKLNPGVKLPNLAISPVYRSDGSGTTADFTQFLTDVSPTWATQIGTNKTVEWPVGTGSSGNAGVAATVSQTKGSIGYVEQAYALQNHFTTQPSKTKLRNMSRLHWKAPHWLVKTYQSCQVICASLPSTRRLSAPTQLLPQLSLLSTRTPVKQRKFLTPLRHKP